MSKKSEARQTMGDNLTHLREDITQTAKCAASLAEGWVADASNEIKHQSVEVQAAIENYVQKNPLKSLGIAALSGIGLALLLFRK